MNTPVSQPIPCRGETNERVELAPYTITAGERVIYGQRIRGVVRLVDVLSRDKPWRRQRRDTGRVISQENVELVRRGMESAQAFWALFDERIVLDMRLVPDSDGEYVGRVAAIQAGRQYWSTFEDYHLDALELIEAGSSIVVIVRERGRGRGSGAPFERRWAQVWTFRSGRIVRWEAFPDRAAAIRAAGRRE